MKIKKFTLLIGLLLATVQAQAGLFKQVSQLQKIIPMTTKLAEKYHLSTEQKQLIRSIIVTELPEAGSYVVDLMANRQQLLDLSSANNSDSLVRQLAQSQGELITGLIIWKESLKKQLRDVLAENQQAFIDEFIRKTVTLRACSIVENNYLSLK